MIKIAKGVSLPLDVVTQTIAILAKRRAGKSYTMRKIVEELLDKGQQVILVDPKGDQWGIRSTADGKSPGFPMVILGGEHGDAPLEVSAGEVVAKLVVEERVSILLDLSVFRKHEIATFMTSFLENLYRLKAKEEFRTPCTIVVDEADAIAPQKPQPNEARMLGAIEDIVRRGGQRGIGCFLITQRSAVLNKNVLTQAQMLIVLRTIAPQDLAAMKAWIEVHGTIEEGKELMDSLPSLPIGDAWFWSPGWPTDAGIFTRSHVLPIKTFDSGATPKPGERKIVPKNLADIDLEVLKKQMFDTIEKAKADDPKELKKQIKVLETQLSEKEKSNISRDEIEAELQSRLEIHIVAIESERNAWRNQMEKWVRYVEILEGVFVDIPAFLRERSEEIGGRPNLEPSAKYAPEKDVPKKYAVGLDLVHSDSTKGHFEIERFGFEPKTEARLSKGARTILTYLASTFPKSKSKAQIWVAAVYSPGGGFNNLIYELTGKGLIASDGPGRFVATNSHTSDMLESDFYVDLNKWDQKLSKGARAIFHLLLENSGSSYVKEDIAKLTGYSMGGGFNNLIYELSGKELIVKNGTEWIINPLILDL